MSKDIFERQFAKLGLGKHTSDIEHCKELANLGYYTEAFLAMWVLVEVIAINVQITYRASIVADSISGSLMKVLIANKVDVKKNGLRIRLIDISFYKAKKMYGSRREYVDVGDVISGLKLVAPDTDEHQVRFLLASKVDKAPIEFPSKTTIRARRNDLVHNNSKIAQDDFKNYENYFDYFFSLTAMVKLSTNGE